MTCGPFHPLAEYEPTDLPRSCSNPADIDFRDPQPVFLNGDVYMKGYKLNGQYRIWKYSSSTNLFSEILAPQQISDKFVLTSYNSQLFAIDAVLKNPEEELWWESMNFEDDPRHKLDIDAWVLVKNKFERSTDVPEHSHRSGNPMPLEDEEWVEKLEALEPDYWEIRATSKDGNLVVAFYRKDWLFDYFDSDDRVETNYKHRYVTVDILLLESHNGKKKWKHQNKNKFLTDKNYVDDDEDDDEQNDSEQPSSTQDATVAMIIDRPSIIINNDTLYIKLWNESDYKNDKNYCELSKMSMRDFQGWQRLPSLTLPKWHSNLSVFNNHTIIAIPRDEELFILALLQTKPHDIWIEIAHIKLSDKFDSNPCIMGLPDDRDSILISGMMKSAHQSGIQTLTLRTLKLVSKGIH